MSVDELEGSAAPLIEHLKELRNRILYSLAAFVVCFIIGYYIWEYVFAFLSKPLCDVMTARHQACDMQMIAPEEGFFVSLRIAIWAGFAMSFPIIAFQMWRFVAPGLYKNERYAFLPFLLASPVMFIIGAGFAYLVVLPFAFTFFLSYQDYFKTALAEGNSLVAATTSVVYHGTLESFFNLTMRFVLAFGLCFQLPVLLTLMGRAGLISSKGLMATRKYAIVGILVLSSMIAPPDVTSMLILFAAIYPLFEVSIWIIVYFERQREIREKADGTWQEPDDE